MLCIALWPYPRLERGLAVLRRDEDVLGRLNHGPRLRETQGGPVATASRLEPAPLPRAGRAASRVGSPSRAPRDGPTALRAQAACAARNKPPKHLPQRALAAQAAIALACQRSLNTKRQSGRPISRPGERGNRCIPRANIPYGGHRSGGRWGLAARQRAWGKAMRSPPGKPGARVGIQRGPTLAATCRGAARSPAAPARSPAETCILIPIRHAQSSGDSQTPAG